MFGVKDVFTTVNLLGGAVAICLCIEGYPFAAGVAVMLGYLFGDTLDGWVARKLGSANAFGAAYDTIADHLAHCIAPAAIVYTVYKDAGLLSSFVGNQLLAVFLASIIMVAASIRHARNEVQPVRYRGVWAGLPRSVLGFCSIAYVNATLAPYLAGGFWLGVVLIPALCAVTLTHLPFPSHHLARKHIWYVRVLIAMFFVTTFGILIIVPHFMFDVLFVWMFGYALTSWMSLNTDERTEYRKAVELAVQGSSNHS
ncbi:MAG: CDP-alcohol phosphatidyltransferase family protein [Proteobacteria bacterium]|nr:CDP-alcohol phosphatidyltransferase family protein [Pseudomonadota bacterium]